jgi:hypothetical protein
VRWAQRLEVACRQIDRLEGPGAGIAALVDDVVRWRPEHGAPRGAQHNITDAGRHRGDVTVHQQDPAGPSPSPTSSAGYRSPPAPVAAPGPAPASAVARLANPPGPRRAHPMGPDQGQGPPATPPERDYFDRLEELEAEDAAARDRLGLDAGELPF